MITYRQEKSMNKSHADTSTEVHRQRSKGKDTKDFGNRCTAKQKICKYSGKSLEDNKNMLIFASSKGEFAERMTTFMACKGRFEPQA